MMKVQNRKCIRRLSRKSLYAARKRNMIAVFAIALTTILFTTLFLISGRFLGNLLYQSSLAGSFILVLSFLCPMMYIASTLNSILNGLGKTGQTFAYSMISLLVRLVFVFFVIPVWGIHGYLCGLIVSQMVQTVLCMAAVRKYR